MIWIALGFPFFPSSSFFLSQRIDGRDDQDRAGKRKNIVKILLEGEETLFNTKRKNEKGEVEVAICPLCKLRVEFIGAPMVRCYSTGDTYDPEQIMWILEAKVSKETGYDVENIRGNDKEQDFLPNAHRPEDEK
jgi:hypothetical protein